MDFQEMTVALRFFPSPSRSGALSDRSLNLTERGDNMLGRIAFKSSFSNNKLDIFMISFTSYDISWITIRGLELVTKPSRWMIVRTAPSQRFL